MDSKAKVFISFFSEEDTIASALKELIKSTFPNHCEVFVSCDRANLPAGVPWLDGISAALHDAKLLVVICSHRSVVRPWIYFEAGCAWEKRIPIIPLCHSGVKKGSLPAPLYVFQAVQLEARDFADEFLTAVGRHLDLQPLTSPIQKEALKKLRNARLKAARHAPPQSVSSVAGKLAGPKLHAVENRILEYLASENDPGPDVGTLAKTLSVSVAKVRHHLDHLVEKEYLVEQRSIMQRYPLYFLTRKGRAHVMQQEKS